MKEDIDPHWEEIKEFAKESGFEAEGDSIFLSLGQLSDVDYGVCILRFDNEIHLFPYARKEGECGYLSQSSIDCYAYNFAIRTAEVGDKKYVLERTKKKEELNKARALILAFKFKDLGTLDPSFLYEVYREILLDLSFSPERGLAEKLIENKISELEEKLVEVETTNLPESPNITNNIVLEFMQYTMIAKEKDINLTIKFPNLAKRTSYNLLFLGDFKEYNTFSEFCQKTGNDNEIKDIAQDIITERILGYESVISKLVEKDGLHQYYVMEEIGEYMSRLIVFGPRLEKNIKCPNLARVFCEWLVYMPFDDQFTVLSLSNYVEFFKKLGNEVKLQVTDKMRSSISEKYFRMLLNDKFKDMLALLEITNIKPQFNAEDILDCANDIILDKPITKEMVEWKLYTWQTYLDAIIRPPIRKA